jgi:SAM-dependent methyltransferase
MDYEYRGLMAQAWDLLRGDTSGWEDRPFFLAAIHRHGEPALDVGCGTGRLLLDYLARGADIDGVDNSPEMLSICRERAAQMGLPPPTLHLQQMEDLDLPRRYRTICVPSSSFQLVVDETAAREALARFHRHLEPGGALVMPFIVMGRPGQPLEESSTSESVRPDGVLVRRHAYARYDPDTQLEHSRDTYELVRDGEVFHSETHERSPATRGYSLTQVRAMLEGAGFEVESVVGGFGDRPYEPESDGIFSVTAVR